MSRLHYKFLACFVGLAACCTAQRPRNGPNGNYDLGPAPEVIFLSSSHDQVGNCQEPAAVLGPTATCMRCQVSCDEAAKHPAATFIHVREPCECVRAAVPDARHVYQPLDNFAVCARQLTEGQKKLSEWWVETGKLKSDVQKQLLEYQHGLRGKYHMDAVNVEVVPRYHSLKTWDPTEIAAQPRSLGVLDEKPLPKQLAQRLDEIAKSGGVRRSRHGGDDGDAGSKDFFHLRALDLAFAWNDCPKYQSAAKKKRYDVTEKQCLSCTSALRLVKALAVGVPTIAFQDYQAVEELVAETGYPGTAKDEEEAAQAMEVLVHNKTARQMLQEGARAVWEVRGPDAFVRRFDVLLAKDPRQVTSKA